MATPPLRKITAAAAIRGRRHFHHISLNNNVGIIHHGATLRIRPSSSSRWGHRSISGLGSAVHNDSDGSGDGFITNTFLRASNNASNNFNNGHSYSHFSTSSASESPSKSFKRIIRPFLRACHPDAMMSAEATLQQQNNKRGHTNDLLSSQAKGINLKAVQTINGLIDTLDDLIGRCIPPSHSRGDSGKSKLKMGALPELNARYEIEFVLSTQPTNPVLGDERKPKRKHKDKVALTLRSITVSFPEQLRELVKKWALTSFPTDSSYEPSVQEEEAYYAAMQLKDHAVGELLRLLTIAGMEVPTSSVEQAQKKTSTWGEQPRKEEGQWTLSDHFLHELGIEPVEEDGDAAASDPLSHSPAFYGRTQSQPQRRTATAQNAQAAPPTYSHPLLQQKRKAFMNSIPWNKFANDYDQAFLDAQANWTTSRLDIYSANTLEGRERREKFVSTICGSVRIWRNQVDGDSEEEENVLDDIPEGLDVVAQLIAIRRLSLILYENFDYLQMEKMGRMWEQLVIVLIPPRRSGYLGENPTKRREDGTRIHPGRKLNKWERAKKKRDRLQPASRGKIRHLSETIYERNKKHAEAEEGGGGGRGRNALSGFKFSYGTQSDQGMGHVSAHVPIDFRDGELVKQLYTHLYDYFDTCCGHNVGFLKYGVDGGVSANVGDDANHGSGSSSSNDGSEESSGDQMEKKMGMED